VVKKLQNSGWFVARVKGSHHIMKLEGRPGSVPVPIHGSKDLSKSLVKIIEKQTGVKLL
jgi:predicted RNA binding protein YcfA (HicA-like mRNA interferase family)